MNYALKSTEITENVKKLVNCSLVQESFRRDPHFDEQYGIICAVTISLLCLARLTGATFCFLIDNFAFFTFIQVVVTALIEASFVTRFGLREPTVISFILVLLHGDDKYFILVIEVGRVVHQIDVSEGVPWLSVMV